MIPSELHSIVQSNQALQEYFTHSFRGIKPKGYCGFLSTPEQEYFIAPKICDRESANLDIFLYMLMVAYDVKISNAALASCANARHKIFEVLIRYFADGLFGELKKGVFKQYITTQENLKVLRGKYLVDENLKYNFKHQAIYCEFDEFSMDNELNRFFLFAIKRLMQYSRYDKLGKCEMILDEVEFAHRDYKRINIHFDRLSSRYKQSFELAVMILERLIPLTSRQNKSFAFLFDMGKVFEQFIGKIVQSIDESTKLQCQKNFGNLQLKPDILTQSLIIDTKYKIIKSREELQAGDKYQMFTYGTNFGINKTMLLYPKHGLDVSEDLVLGIREKAIELKMRSIDLESDSGFEGFVEEMKIKLEEMKDGNNH